MNPKDELDNGPMPTTIFDDYKPVNLRCGLTILQSPSDGTYGPVLQKKCACSHKHCRLFTPEKLIPATLVCGSIALKRP